MTKPDRSSPKVKEYLRLLGNQYACLSIFADEDELQTSASTEAAQSNLATYEQEKPIPPALLSKSDFRSLCRRVFGQYIPEFEKGKLRQHHRDFITRNESRPAAARAFIAAQLLKYDISR